MPNIVFTARLDDKVSRSLLKIQKRFKNFNPFKETNRDLKKVSLNLNKLDKKIKKMNKSGLKIGGGAKGGMGGMKGIGGIGAAIGAVFAGGAVAKDIIQITAEMERYNAILTNTLGSSTKAKESMDMIQKVAAKTPFEINNLTDSYITLVNRGFKPTEDEIISLGDLASTLGKDFGDISTGLLNAQTGNYEILRNMGIDIKKEGDKLNVSFRDEKVQIDATKKGITDYVIALGNMKGVTGAMASESATLIGKFSNFQDILDQIKVKIGAAFSPFIIESLTTITNKIEELSPKIESLVGKYGPQISKVLTEVVDWVMAFVDNISIVKDIFMKLIGHHLIIFDTIKQIFNTFGKTTDKVTTLKNILQGVFQVVNFLMTPLKIVYTLYSKIYLFVFKSLLAFGKWLLKFKFVQKEIQKIVDLFKIIKKALDVTLDWIEGWGDGVTNLNKNLNKTKDITAAIYSDMFKVNHILDKFNRRKDTSERKRRKNKESTTDDTLSGNDDTLSGNDTVLKTDRSVKNTTVSIGNMIEGGLNISTKNITESAVRIREIVGRALRLAIADSTAINY